MLSDFDLAKASGEPGGRPATIAQNALTGLPLVDTKSCTSHVRANSFVGTEGEHLICRPLLLDISGISVANCSLVHVAPALFQSSSYRVYRSRSNKEHGALGLSRLVDAG